MLQHIEWVVASAPDSRPRDERMTRPTYDQAFWEQLWTKTLHEHADKVSARAPNAQLVSALASVPAGRALDAGCGHGAETLWLATRGWNVTAVDFSASALAHGRAMAEALGASVSTRITWVEGDLARWTPPSGHFDLVVSLYVHISGPRWTRQNRPVVDGSNPASHSRTRRRTAAGVSHASRPVASCASCAGRT